MRFVSLALLICACGGDGSLTGGDTPAEGDLYFLFERAACTGDTLEGLDLAGVWHQDITFDVGGSGFSVLRWDVDGDRYRSALSGVVTRRSRVTPSEIWVEDSGTRASGTKFRRAYLFCQKESNDRLVGRYITCTQPTGQEESCFEASAASQRLLRLSGEQTSQGLTLVSEFAGGANPWPFEGNKITINVRVDDGLAYVARYNDGLRIVDVANPAAPAQLGSFPTSTPNEIWNDLKIVTRADNRKFALMASSERGIVVLDVSNPNAPQLSTTFGTHMDGAGVHTLFVEPRGGQIYAYTADNITGGLEVWNVTDPASPSFVSAYVSPLVQTQSNVFVHDLYVEDGIAYLCYWNEGLVLVDTKPATPVVVGQFKDYTRRTTHSVWVTTAGGRKLAVLGDEDFSAHLRVVDVDPASATYMDLVGELSLRPEVSIHNIMAFGNTAYIAWYQDGIRTIDLSNPAAPSLSGYYNTWEGGPGNSFFEGAVGLDVDLDAKLVYVADVSRGLLVLRLP